MQQSFRCLETAQCKSPTLKPCRNKVRGKKRPPNNFLTKYVLFCPSCSTSIMSPPILRNIGFSRFFVFQIVILQVFKCKPTHANSSPKLATIFARATSLFAYNVKGLRSAPLLTIHHHHNEVCNVEHEASIFTSHIPSQH